MFARPAPCRPKSGEFVMAWKKPRIVEVSLALEINSYACAEIG
ncbi:pyrroloquinoline quinone precursor peptide PqqA [Roseococcus sp.]